MVAAANRLFWIENEFVGKGVVRKYSDEKIDNDMYLLSNHPLSPFKGNAFKWNSWIFDDGTSYEGLTLEDMPHGKGTIIMGNISAAGLTRYGLYDRYEGELHAGFAHGLGLFFSSVTGELYLGEFNFGKKQGCGIKIKLDKFFDLIRYGFSYKKAWMLSKKYVSRNSKMGTFSNNDFHLNLSDSSNFSINGICNTLELKGLMCELKNILVRTRMFTFKPNSYVHNKFINNSYTFIDMQHPTLYSFNTGFLAPGPLGQCFSCPNDAILIKEMNKVSLNSNYENLSYNLIY
mmetsp:Transcript_25139/g.35087  ORF Transcript_25139/g.35087 Transcript_25139/m.35087 type:complete len:289 (-) Transcript_25139:237-1103(-)